MPAIVSKRAAAWGDAREAVSRYRFVEHGSGEMRQAGLGQSL
jgi:hypothetical protein